MTAFDALVWAAAGLFAVMALTFAAYAAALGVHVIAARRDRRQPGPPVWVNQSRILDDVTVDQWCRQLERADDASIWRELNP